MSINTKKQELFLSFVNFNKKKQISEIDLRNRSQK